MTVGVMGKADTFNYKDVDSCIICHFLIRGSHTRQFHKGKTTQKAKKFVLGYRDDFALCAGVCESHLDTEPEKLVEMMHDFSGAIFLDKNDLGELYDLECFYIDDKSSIRELLKIAKIQKS